MIRKVNPKRAKKDRVYSVRRKAFLEARPWCEAYPVILGWAVEHDRALMENLYTPRTHPRSEDVHHKFRRGKFYLDESTWIACSRWAHDFIHQNPIQAKALGLLG